MTSARVLVGDCREVLRTLEPNSVDSIVTDPPAGIGFMGRSWDHDKGGRDHWIAWMQEVAALALAAAKPGAHALVWALPRTSHWTATAWENAGWEVREKIAHLFGSGFPKSLDVSKALDRMAGAVREVVGVRSYAREGTTPVTRKATSIYAQGCGHNVGQDSNVITAPATDAARQWQGWGTALKPAMEDWWLLRKPLAAQTVAANVLDWGCGALNIDGCRVGTSKNVPASGRTQPRSDGWGMKGDETTAGFDPLIGRFPANLIHDGSEEVEEAFAAFGERPSAAWNGKRNTPKTRGVYGEFEIYQERGKPADTGTASRFFMRCPPDPLESGEGMRFIYEPKASKADRMGTAHPTTKPTNLIAYLARLITPPGGTVLDPFAGSGTLAVAAFREGFNAILIEQNPEYVEMIHKRIATVEAEAKPDAKPQALPLFDGLEAVA